MRTCAEQVQMQEYKSHAYKTPKTCVMCVILICMCTVFVNSGKVTDLKDDDDDEDANNDNDNLQGML